MAHAQIRSLNYYEVGILAYIAMNHPAVQSSRICEAMRPLPIVGMLGDLLHVYQMIRVPTDTTGNLMTGYVALTNAGREYLETYGRQVLDGAKSQAEELADATSEASAILSNEERDSKRKHLAVVISHLERWMNRDRVEVKEDLDSAEVDQDMIPSHDEHDDETVAVREVRR